MTAAALIIENEAMLRRALVRSLKKFPVQVIEATSHEGARALIEEHADSIVILFMDRYLDHPSSDAGEFLEWAAERAPRARRVLMSGAERRKMALDPKLYDVFLQKPFPIAKFRAELEVALNKPSEETDAQGRERRRPDERSA